jgi:hypothetical protein
LSAGYSQVTCCAFVYGGWGVGWSFGHGEWSNAQRGQVVTVSGDGGGSHGWSAEPPHPMCMYKGWSVWSFLLVAPCIAGKGGGEGGGRGLCGCAGFGCLLLCHGPWATGSCVVRKHTPFIRLVARGDRFISPPSSLLRLNPSVSIPKEGDHHRSPFQATIPCGLTMLPQSNGLIGRNVTV